MQIEQFNDLDELYQRAHQWVADKIREFGATSLYLPAGRSPEPLYFLWEQVRPPYLNGLQLLQVDDITTGQGQGQFRQFFSKCLPSYQAQLVEVQSGPKQADLGILGLGVNGHIAFHEPGLPKDFKWGPVELSTATCQYLGYQPPVSGVSYGIGSFMRTKALLLLVIGSNKAKPFQGFMRDDPSVPASFLSGHPDLTILVDPKLSSLMKPA